MSQDGRTGGFQRRQLTVVFPITNRQPSRTTHRSGARAVTDSASDSSEQPSPKRFRIQRKRLGTIRFIDPKGEFGFITAEDFRDDVFFHVTVWEPLESADRQQAKERPGKEGRAPTGKSNPPGRTGLGRDGETKLDPEAFVGKNVEFELDDELFEAESRLRAKSVRLTKRPMGRKLSGRDATFKVVTHHPRARRKRPDWREGKS